MTAPKLSKEGRSAEYIRGFVEAYQDRCENVPFAGIGGMDSRHTPTFPDYIPEADQAEWLEGYQRYCKDEWGEDWRDAKFGWQPALTIGGKA